MTETAFDPNAVGVKVENIYGLPFTTDDASIVVIPVPWEVTVSYGAGTAAAPEAVLGASYQVDLYDPDYPNAWNLGLAMHANGRRIYRHAARGSQP